MYFWKSGLIPKELQDHIEKTLKSLMKKGSGGLNQKASIQNELENFIKESETIVSGSNSIKEKNKKE